MADSGGKQRLLFLQGDKRIGKTTLLRTLLRRYQHQVGGFYVQRIIEQEQMRGFLLRSVQEDGLEESGDICRNRIFLERTGQGWVFHKEVFANWASSLLDQEQERGYPLFLLDEIGGIELGLPRFKKTLYRLLQSEYPCIGTYKQEQNSRSQSQSMDTGIDYQQNRSELAALIASEGGRILTLTGDCRERIETEAAAFISRFLSVD